MPPKKGASKAAANTQLGTKKKSSIADHLRWKRVARGMIVSTSTTFSLESTELHNVVFPPTGGHYCSVIVRRL